MVVVAFCHLESGQIFIIDYWEPRHMILDASNLKRQLCPIKNQSKIGCDSMGWRNYS